jgi:hypothetical protein
MSPPHQDQAKIRAKLILDPDFCIPPRYYLSLDPRGYVRISLGLSHPHSNSAGWQYLSRHIVMMTTGELLRSDEHVHHINGLLLDHRRDNLKVMLCEYHGRHHANHQLLYMFRDRVTGRFMESEVPRYSEQAVSMDLDEIP